MINIYIAHITTIDNLSLYTNMLSYTFIYFIEFYFPVKETQSGKK